MSPEKLNQGYIDTHVHLWDLSNHINNWVLRSDNSELKQSFLPDQLLSDPNLKGFVHIEAHDDAIDTLIEQQWLTDTMQNYPDVWFRSIAHLDLTLRPETFEDRLLKLKTYPHCVGIRHILSHHPHYKYSPCLENLSQHPHLFDNIQTLQQHNFLLEFQGYPQQLLNLLPILEQTQVKCMIEHFGLPIWDNKHDQILWHHSLTKAAQLNNLYLKLSGFDMFITDAPCQYVVETALELFGDQRCVYGSNRPVSSPHQSNHWKTKISMLIPEDQSCQFFKENALKIY